MMSTNDAQILIVDDDELDVELAKRAFRKAGFDNRVKSADNGEVALEMLRGINGSGRLKQPFIILLDLNMPRMDGHEFLEALRADRDLASSVVFVLTTSNVARDVAKAYSKNIAGYVLKSSVGDGFVTFIDMLVQYGSLVEFPPNVTGNP